MKPSRYPRFKISSLTRIMGSQLRTCRRKRKMINGGYANLLGRIAACNDTEKHSMKKGVNNTDRSIL